MYVLGADWHFLLILFNKHTFLLVVVVEVGEIGENTGLDADELQIHAFLYASPEWYHHNRWNMNSVDNFVARVWQKIVTICGYISRKASPRLTWVDWLAYTLIFFLERLQHSPALAKWNTWNPANLKQEACRTSIESWYRIFVLEKYMHMQYYKPVTWYVIYMLQKRITSIRINISICLIGNNIICNEMRVSITWWELPIRLVISRITRAWSPLDNDVSYVKLVKPEAFLLWWILILTCWTVGALN